MNYLTLENVTKTYGSKLLFKDVTLHIDKGQKIALVAKNGTGKTTLLRVLAGEEGVEGEQSKILISKEIRTGVLVQEPKFDPRMTVEAAVFDSQNHVIQAIKDYEAALLLGDDKRIETAMQRMDDFKAWEMEAKMREILSKLKIDRLQERVGILSGGQQKRLALAKLLLDEPDFLILDEPTNHLDLEMIEWLEAYLTQSNRTIFMVSHDRYFLDAVCNTIIELDGGKFHRYKGNYAAFLEQKAARLENEAANLDRTKKLYRKELDWMRRQPQARTTKAKSRIDDFFDIKEKAQKRLDTDVVKMDIKNAWLGGKIVELHNISKKYGNLNLIENFSYKFKRKERVGIVGRNGAGKSTILNILTGALESDTGKVVIGETLVFGHYDQSGMDMKVDKRVIEVITDIAEFIPLEKGLKLTASGLLERFLFPREQQQVYVSQLSGGEKRRLYLMTILMKNPNFLILDEPTNDLDIVTLNVLEDFLEDYQGCLVIVTHDRYFMDKLVDHLFIFEGDGKIKDYNGNYTEYREQRKLDERAAQSSQKVDKPATNVVQNSRNVDKRALQNLEKEIAKLEKREKELTEKFNDPKIKHDDIAKFSKELGEVKALLEEKELKWLEMSE
jgi:ABC transport system ATP-binding/permease protein